VERFNLCGNRLASIRSKRLRNPALLPHTKTLPGRAVIPVSSWICFIPAVGTKHPSLCGRNG
jgi:hypothetical protein